LLYNQLTHLYSVLKLFNNFENIQPVRTSKTRNGAFNSVEQPICSCVTGQPEVFKNTSGRVVILTSYMTSLVLLAAYSAFLISSLAVQRQDLPFRDLQSLLYDGSYKLGVLRNSSQFNILSVCGIKYLWPDYLVVVGLGLWKKMIKCEDMLY
jgi:hypothetical protein